MDTLPDTCILTSVRDGLSVEATIVKLTRDLATREVDGKWWHLEGTSAGARSQEIDHRWQWRKLVGGVQNKHWYESVAIQTMDGVLQGAMVYVINAKSFVDESLGAVYIEALATAPHNRPWVVKSPLYRGVGESLLTRAVIHSYQLGLEGRVSLMASSEERTVSFYNNRGFAIVGYEDNEECSPKLELSSQAALSWLEREGYEP